MRGERGSQAGLCWEREMLDWGGEILPLRSAACWVPLPTQGSRVSEQGDGCH